QRPLWSRSCRREASRPVPKGPCMTVTDDVVVFASGEKEDGRTDLNGDTDFHDAVIQAWDVSSATLTSTALAGEHKGALVGGGIAGFRVSEKDQLTVLNGDGDTGDLVI